MLARWQTVDDAMADVDREVGVLAALDAVEEVAVLAGRVGEQLDLVGADHRVEDLVGAGLQLGRASRCCRPSRRVPMNLMLGLPGLQVITTPLA